MSKKTTTTCPTCKKEFKFKPVKVTSPICPYCNTITSGPHMGRSYAAPPVERKEEELPMYICMDCLLNEGVLNGSESNFMYSCPVCMSSRYIYKDTVYNWCKFVKTNMIKALMTVKIQEHHEKRTTSAS